MKNKAKIFVLIFIMLIAAFKSLGNAEASSARVMISDYQVENEVVSGGDFKITITLKNTATKVVKNVKLTIYTDNGEFYPTEGAGTAYISEIAAETEEEFTFCMAATTGLEEKSYKLSAKIEYDDYYGTEYTVDEFVYIPVGLDRGLSLTDVYYEDGIELGETVEITAMINNTGRGTLYNVSVDLTGDNVKDQTSYVGTLEAGESEMVDFLTNSKKVKEEFDKNTMTISYEDEEGNLTTEEFNIGAISIEEPQYDDLEKVVTKKDSTDLTQYIKEIAVCVVVVFVIAIIVFLKYRRKKKISEEF